MWNVHTNIQYASHHILLKDEQSTIYQKKVPVSGQCLLKLLKEMLVVPTTFFDNAPEVKNWIWTN